MSFQDEFGNESSQAQHLQQTDDVDFVAEPLSCGHVSFNFGAALLVAVLVFQAAEAAETRSCGILGKAIKVLSAFAHHPQKLRIR